MTPTDVPVGSADVPAGSRTPPAASPTTATPKSTATPDPDPDGDGFTDCEERRLLADANSERMDVYVEVDWTAGARPNVEELRELVAVYDHAPVENPSGEAGIALHLVFGDRLPAREGPLGLSNASSYDGAFDDAGRGDHHAVFVGEFEAAFGKADPGSLVVQRLYPNRSATFHVDVFAHELGHSLGLTREVFEGVDNSFPYEQYPSVMNRRGVYQTRSSSNGSAGPDDFDDWAYHAEHLYVPDTSRPAERSACRAGPRRLSPAWSRGG